jgi:hypothetical protein
MVFSATFNNSSVISLRSDLSVVLYTDNESTVVLYTGTKKTVVLYTDNKKYNTTVLLLSVYNLRMSF